MAPDQQIAQQLDARLIMTEPLRVYELADLFSVERHEMRKLLDVIPGAIQTLGFWRVPIVSMPPCYWLARKLIQAATVPAQSRR
jgi:hypothetical protein